MLYNRIIIIVFITWLLSQLTKGIIFFIINKKWDKSRFFGDAGMPSSHTAMVTSLAPMVGIQCGWNSPLFAIASIFAAIVMHDAVGVRQETGKQAKVINGMLKLFESMGRGELTPDEMLKEFVGHTGRQVFVGAIFGIAVAVMMHFILP